MASTVNNYTLGRGELHFGRFKQNTQTPSGERYFGNTPEWNATIESDNLDHFSSDHGINEKDASIVLNTNRSGSFTTDNINYENVALFFFGSVSALTVVGAAVTGEAIDDVEQGLGYQLGVTSGNPVGARALDPEVPIVVTDDAGSSPVTYTLNTDYIVDTDQARITIVKGGTITKGTNLVVGYTTLDSTRSRIISGSAAVEGSLRYIEINPVGENKTWFMPYVKLSPNGDYALKGDDWQVIPFNVEILKKTGLEAIYIDGAPLITP